MEVMSIKGSFYSNFFSVRNEENFKKFLSKISVEGGDIRLNSKIMFREIGAEKLYQITGTGIITGYDTERYGVEQSFQMLLDGLAAQVCANNKVALMMRYASSDTMFDCAAIIIQDKQACFKSFLNEIQKEFHLNLTDF